MIRPISNRQEITRITCLTITSCQEHIYAYPFLPYELVLYIPFTSSVKFTLA